MMTPLKTTIDIARTPAEVFALATDPARFGEWQPDVVRARMLGGGRMATTRRMRGGERTITQQITRNQPPDRWSARGVEGPIRAHASIEVEPLDGGTASRVTFTLDFEGHGLGVPLVPLVRRQAERAAPASYARLKRLLEARPVG